MVSGMENPTVSFVVPCYKLAHLLPACVVSILSQSYDDLEVLVMDDCSPDETPQVTRSFGDSRVRHLRNERNLGHLRNYNKGIELARGKYVWLISADDYLRRPYVLRSYVDLMDDHPSIGYSFCAGMRVEDGAETEVLDYSKIDARDRIIPGHTWLKRQLMKNHVLSASGMVRRDCYDRFGAFPLDMPWCGDWYLWCLFALYWDVGYFAEPMVCYRRHALSMTSDITQARAEACSREEISIPWAIKKRADADGFPDVSRDCLRAAGEGYARNTASLRFRRTMPVLSRDQFEDSLCQYTSDEGERDWVRAYVYSAIGDYGYRQGDLESARHFYEAALAKNPHMARTLVKRALLSLGPLGSRLRRFARAS